MTVNGLRLVHELRGFPCRMLEVQPPPKKSICVAPSFGRLVPDLDTITDALTTHLTRAGEKLRRQDSLCGALTVFLHTNRFRKTPTNGLPAKQYYNSRTIKLPHPTNSTPELLRYAQSILKSIFAFGYNYQKVGLIMTDLVPADYRQKGVFVDGPDKRLIRLAGVVDKLNHQYGQDKLRLASQLYNPDWPMQQQFLYHAVEGYSGGSLESYFDRSTLVPNGGSVRSSVKTLDFTMSVLKIQNKASKLLQMRCGLFYRHYQWI